MEAFLLSIAEFEGTISEGEEAAIWRWLYERDGRVEGAFLAEDEEGRVVAHYGVAPWAYSHGSDDFAAGLLCKLAIDERYRKSPLFMALSRTVLAARYEDEGPLFAFGLANRPGLLPFHLAMGLRHIGDVPVFAKPLRFERVAPSMLSERWSRWAVPPARLAGRVFRAVLRRLASRMSKRWLISPVEEFDEAFDRLDASRLDGRFRASRSAAMLRHRFAEGPPRGYQVYRVDSGSGLAGYFVLRRMPMREFDTLAVVDLVLAPDAKKALGSVLRFVDGQAVEQGVDLISVLAGDPGLRNGLRRQLYFETPESFQLLVHPSAGDRAALSEALAGATIDAWYLTWFDSDYV